MGRIRVLSDQVANQIAAGEVVDRPASVVKELLENALDAGANRIRVEVEAGGRKLIRIADDGCGMNRDDALLAFERHATSKLRTADDLLAIATLGFRGEALPSIASVARVTLETATGEEAAGTRIEIAGGRMTTVEEAALPRGTTFTVADLFFNIPARKKFLRAESTELAHVTALVTHYALVHPEKHFELISATHTVVSAPPVGRSAERVYQIFGKDTLAGLLPVAAELPLDRTGLPEPPPWKIDPAEPKRAPGVLRITGFYSKPQLQKLNRNSIYIFVNKRLIRDRLILHAITEAYRNVIPHTSFPVVLLFLEMPPEEVDVNVHPAKTEVRFRQSNVIHDFVRDSLRTALVAARPTSDFLAPRENSSPLTPSLMPVPASSLPGPPDSDPLSFESPSRGAVPFHLTPRQPAAAPGRLEFEDYRPASAEGWDGGDRALWGEAAKALFSPATPDPALPEAGYAQENRSVSPVSPFTGAAEVQAAQSVDTLDRLANARPIGQLRDSFILASSEDGLWIIDQHTAHERVLFEKVLRERDTERVQRQRLLMPLLVELKPWQMVVFSRIAAELERNGFEVEPFGPQTLAVKAAPAGLEGQNLEQMLAEVIEKSGDESGHSFKNEDLETVRARIAASIACHAAIKVNTPLDPARMGWLLLELAKTCHPTSCPHGRPIALLYSWREIQRAFHRI